MERNKRRKDVPELTIFQEEKRQRLRQRKL